MTNPRLFFESYVLPTVSEWEASQLDVRLATLAVSQIDIIADHFICHTQPGIQRHAVSVERDKISTLEPALGTVRDIHDTHKHGALSRRSAQITRGQRPFTMTSPVGAGAVGEFAVGEFAGTLLVVILDNGTCKVLADIIQQALRYWRSELNRAGL